MNKKVAIMSIGDELMNGSTVDTNSTWISSKISIFKPLVIESKITVQDDLDSIICNLNNLIINNYKYIFITGGLGPTHDDVTKKAFCELFSDEMSLDEEYLSQLKNRFEILSKS